jgi:hypothetical protein
MRNPHDPIPGFEDEYTGTAGHEKAIHHDSFHVKQMPKLRKSDFDSGYEWVEIRPGRWKLLPKKVLEDAERRR